jgi:hypothetical protein
MVAAMSLRESFGSSLDWTEDADGSRSDGLSGQGTESHSAHPRHGAR